MDFGNPVNVLVVFFFTIDDIGLYIAAAIAASCVAIILDHRKKEFLPNRVLLENRLSALKTVGMASNDEEAQTVFAENFEFIDEAMISTASTGQGENLRHAWTQFRETIIDESKDIKEATARPEGYFLHLYDEGRTLGWWANIFVAVGLTFTFLGIVAALLEAVSAMESNSSNMQLALVNLLQITATKFWTSISGVGSSIALRFYDRRYGDEIRRQLQLICDRIEFGTLFSPPQRLAALQLEQSKQQTAALTTFSTEVALAIAKAFDKIGTNVGAKIEEHAGTEIRSLATSLQQLNQEVSDLSEELAAMSGAFKDTTDTFGEHVDGLRGAAVSSLIVSDVLSQAATAIEAAYKPLSEVELAAEQVTEKLTQIVTDVQLVVAEVHEATKGAADNIETVADGIDKTNAAAKVAWEEYRARFGEIDDALVTAVERIANSTRDHAQNLNTFVGRVDEGVAGAVENLRSALDRIGDLADALEAAQERAKTGSED